MDYFNSSSVIYTVPQFSLYKKKKISKLLAGLQNCLNTNGIGQWRFRWPQSCFEVVVLWPENGRTQADVHWRGENCRPDNIEKNSILQEPLWDRRFLPSSLSLPLLFPNSRRCEASRLWSERDGKHTLLQQYPKEHINLIVLCLVPRCRHVVIPPSSWLSQMVMVLLLFPSFSSCLIPSPSFLLHLCLNGLQTFWWGQELPLNKGRHTYPSQINLTMAWTSLFIAPFLSMVGAFMCQITRHFFENILIWIFWEFWVKSSNSKAKINTKWHKGMLVAIFLPR